MKLPAQKELFQSPQAEKYLTAILPRLEDKKVRSVTSIALSLITLSFFGIFAISPTLSTIADLKKQITDNEFVNSQLKQKITNLSLLQDSYRNIQNDLPVLNAAIPANPDVTVLVGQLQTIAQETNVTLTQVQTLSVDVSSLPTTIFNSYVFALDITGSYENIKTFFDTTTGFNRLITIDAVSLTRPTGNSDLYNVSVRGKAYFKPL